LQVPRRVIQDGWLGVAVPRQVGQEAFGGGLLARSGEVLDGALRGEPGGDCYKGVVAIGRQVCDPGRIGGDMLCLVLPAALAEELGYVEDAVRIGAGADALGGEGLDVGDASVLEGDALIEGVELGVLVVDLGRVGKLDSEDTDPTSSYVTVSRGAAYGEGGECNSATYSW
jgi:hypothetical protein